MIAGRQKFWNLDPPQKTFHAPTDALRTVIYTSSLFSRQLCEISLVYFFHMTGKFMCDSHAEDDTSPEGFAGSTHIEGCLEGSCDFQFRCSIDPRLYKSVDDKVWRGCPVKVLNEAMAGVFRISCDMPYFFDPSKYDKSELGQTKYQSVQCTRNPEKHETVMMQHESWSLARSTISVCHDVALSS